MTREIKFRAWDNKRGIFIGNDLLFAFANCALYYQRDKVIELRDGLQNPYLGDRNNELEMDLIYLQYTGLKDKNGKEIYEGDVVRIWADPKDYNGYKGHNYIGVVEWDEFILGFILSDGHGLKDFEFIEIVGNIYENPELLNKEGEYVK